MTGAPAANATIVEMLLNGGIATKTALVILVFFSVVAWAIMISKFFSYRRARADTAVFQKLFLRNKSLDDIYNAARKIARSPMSGVFLAGYAEFESEFRAASLEEDAANNRYFLEKIDGIARSLDRAVAQETTVLERNLFFLATTGSISPFIGLFGTVWGIMESFRAIGLTGAANIAVVAPGIAEALVATAAGLVTAIPAVMGYNYFSQRVKVFATEMDNFSLDFLSLIEKNFVKRT
ncbi:MAG: protein TolQ [Nitrospinae bacterium]|nr:protein TolQ [Nitrospinota bacterium]